MTIRVGVTGAGGRMGAEVCRAIQAAEDLQLAAAVDPGAAGAEVCGVTVAGSLEALQAAEVVVDFTTAAATREVLRWCSQHRVHAVVGTTGLDDAELKVVGGGLPPGVGLIVAANFAIGAVLMMRFAELAAPWFDGAEIVELHHDGKLDAPSGTALTTARRMAAARDIETTGKGATDATTSLLVPGARGGEGPGGIRIHSVRLKGLVANQEVLLGSTGETLTLRHDSTDRAAFMPGVLLAVRAVGQRPGLTVGLDPLLGL